MSLSQGVGNAASGAAAGATVAGPVGAIVGGIGGLISGLFSSDGSDEAKALQAKNQAIWDGLQIPALDKALLLQTYQQNGTLTPEMIQKLPLQADTKQVIKENPDNRNNQQMAMNTLKQLSQTGMSAQDMAEMSDLRGKVAGDEQAKTQQILQDEAQRGQTGSGNALAAQLASAQGGAQNASKGAIDVAAKAADARQNALKGFADLSGQVRTQDFNTENTNMQNELARQRFLDQNSLARQQQNVQAINNANLYNLQRQQQVGDTNVAAQNQELQRQVQAKQQMFADQAQKAAGQTGVNNAGANMAQNTAANQAQGNTNMWNGIGQFATAGKKAGLFDGPASTGTTNATPFAAANGIQEAMSKYAHGGRVEANKPNPIDHQHAKNLGKILDIIKQRETVKIGPTDDTTKPGFSQGGQVQSDSGTFSEGGRYDAGGNNTFGSNAYAQGGMVDRGPAMDMAATKASDESYHKKYDPEPGSILDRIQKTLSGGDEKKFDGGRMDPIKSIVSSKMKKGGKVPGTPKVDRDDPINDTVEAKLSPEEIVVPISHAKDPDKAKQFIDNVFKKESKEKSSPKKAEVDPKSILQMMAKLHNGK